jgi:hypothetical protein
VWLRGGARTVQVYTRQHDLIATHDRAMKPGERQTQLAHLPQEKVPGVVLSREGVLLQAETIGSSTQAVVQQLLAHRPEDRLRSAGRVVRLAERYGSERLEGACARAQHFGETDYPAIKRILDAGLDDLPVTDRHGASSPEPARYAFTRQVGDFVASLVGAVR